MSAASRLPQLVRQSLDSLPGGAYGLVVAVSGGADSVALTRAAVEVHRTEAPLVLAHLNHQLRGAESDADEAFVIDLHARLHSAGVPNLHYVTERHDVRSEARALSVNLEAHARQVRYQWLVETAQRFNIRWVATGHTSNDQAETVLHRLLRGTGLRGLRGIAARRELEAGVGVVRPLLQVTRADVLDYLEKLGQPFRHDASNDNLDLTRNRIRRELLPLLAERYNPAIATLLTRLADQAAEAFHEEEQAAMRLLRDGERPRAGAGVVLDCAALTAAPRQLVRELFRLVWQRERWPMGAMDYAAWDRLASLVFGEIKVVDLPGGVRARRRETVVEIHRIV